jgi:hypothetical protein
MLLGMSVKYGPAALKKEHVLNLQTGAEEKVLT